MNNLLVLRSPLLMALLSMLLFSCHNQQSDDESKNNSSANAVVTVKTAQVVEDDALLTVNSYGRTDALKKEKLYAPLGGRIVSLKAFEGTAVSKGDVIAVIQTKESESAVLGAESMLQTAVTPAQKEEAERILRLAQATQKSVTVTAKFDGYVSTRNVSEGELVSENAELMTIVDLSTVDFIADVQLRDLPSVAVGQHASIKFQFFPEKIFPAIVDAINPQANVQSQTVKVRLRFQQLTKSIRGILKTDMNGTVSIVTGKRSHALFIPNEALLRNDENNTYAVMTVTADSLSLRIPVNVGITTDSKVEIWGPGIRKGMEVIIEGNYALSDSSRVIISH
jgi:multidrug efflux pump subunit AcrA (membrane-fusion protein)